MPCFPCWQRVGGVQESEGSLCAALDWLLSLSLSGRSQCWAHRWALRATHGTPAEMWSLTKGGQVELETVSKLISVRKLSTLFTRICFFVTLRIFNYFSKSLKHLVCCPTALSSEQSKFNDVRIWFLLWGKEWEPGAAGFLNPKSSSSSGRLLRSECIRGRSNVWFSTSPC